MNEINRDELEKAMTENGKLENVCMFVANNFGPDHYFRMCVPHRRITKEGVRNFNIWVGDEVWFFLANAHPNARKVNGREVWNCDLVYRGYGWTDDDGRYYGVEVFTVHPKEQLEKWS